MGKKENEIIRLRNEGMAYALKVVKQGGVEELEKQVRLRGMLKVTLRYSPEELEQSVYNISERVYNNMLTLWYAVFHDRLGFGEARLKKLKQWFDEKVCLVGQRSPMGSHWATIEDYGEEANRLYNLGIDLDRLRETQMANDAGQEIALEADSLIEWLKDHGYPDASIAVREEVYGSEAKQAAPPKERKGRKHDGKRQSNRVRGR